MDKQCLVCDKSFHAERVTAKFCSAACKLKYNRQVSEPRVLEHQKHNEWFNSAETKTLAEIEAHYTLANFPPVKYYSTGGSGSGSYSPYPKTNPKSIAYI